MTTGGRDLPIRVGLCSVTLRGHSRSEVVAVASDARIDAIEWGGDIHVPRGDLGAAREAAQLCADAGIECPSYGSYYFAGYSDGAEISPVLDTAEELGAALIRIWTRFGVGPGAGDESRAEICDAVAEFATQAASRGQSVGLEFHDHTLTETAASALRLVEAVGAQNLTTYWQPVTPTRGDERAELEQVIEQCSHLHVQQLDDDGESVPLSDGVELWRDLLAIAAASEPAGVSRRVAYLEFVKDGDPDGVVADAAVLRALTQALPSRNAP